MLYYAHWIQVFFFHGLKQRYFIRGTAMPTDQKNIRTRKPISHRELLKKLPASERAAIKKGAEKLLAEYRLQQLREALSMTQVELAELLDIRQASVSDIEKRTDLKLSTLNRYVEALGGKLHLEVEFPKQSRVRLDVSTEIQRETSHA